jgi:hypothetical protein
MTSENFFSQRVWRHCGARGCPRFTYGCLMSPGRCWYSRYRRTEFYKRSSSFFFFAKNSAYKCCFCRFSGRCGRMEICVMTWAQRMGVLVCIYMWGGSFWRTCCFNFITSVVFVDSFGGLLAITWEIQQKHPYAVRETLFGRENSLASHQTLEAAVCSVRIHRYMQVVGGMRHDDSRPRVFPPLICHFRHDLRTFRALICHLRHDLRTFRASSLVC